MSKSLLCSTSCCFDNVQSDANRSGNVFIVSSHAKPRVQLGNGIADGDGLMTRCVSNYVPEIRHCLLYSAEDDKPESTSYVLYDVADYRL
ncbi:hypothetical protein CDAR_19511 [Caerostris darwini]|uniref:Recombination activating protein 2 n=1 Tax=Caerostris darwini TaxID=1538125 RepID=A0AAV4WG41_9ARAC|nr:hypothetical protein CDAR_19511 [Caerostris darwini]